MHARQTVNTLLFVLLATSPTTAGAWQWESSILQQATDAGASPLAGFDTVAPQGWGTDGWDTANWQTAEPSASPEIDFNSVDQSLTVRGQSGGDSGGGDLAALAQNPVANLAAFPLQSNWNFGNGAADRTQYVGLFQPVVPWKLGENWNLITRMIVPFVNTPVGLSSNTHGLGDSQGQFFFSPNTDGAFIWGAGPMVIYPTASDPVLGFGEWGVGFDTVGLISTGKIVAGALLTQAWGVDGNTAPFLLQPFFNYNFQKGYFVNISGEAAADWEVPAASRWSFPFGAGVGRTFAIAGQPLTLQTRFAPYLEAPPGGPDWQFRFAVSFLFPR